jgi:dTDP-4-amino-4,6-dideoxygalactose transaminase
MAACMKLKNLRAGKSEIIMPAYACPDLVSAALYAGAIPILVDLEENSPSMSCERVLKNITAHTVAIVGINFLGLPGNLPQLKKICADNGLFLIYDCAQWFPLEQGYIWPGDFNTISFGRGKPVSLLHGGAVIMDNPEVEKALPAFSVKKSNAIYNLAQALKVEVYNYMLHPLIYRFAKQLPGLNVGQTLYKPLQTIAPMSSYYANLIKSNIDRFRAQKNVLLYLHKSITSIPHPQMINIVTEELDDDPEYLLRYPILIKDKASRDLFYERTRDYGTSILYRRPLDQISGLENILDQAYVNPNACNFADHLVTLPCHEDIDNTVVDVIVDKLRSVLNKDLG